MSRPLPERPSLQHLRKQAKDLLRDARAGEAEAVQRMGSAVSADTKLSHAQAVIAREYGFASWSKLKRFIESSLSAADAFAHAVHAKDAAAVPRILQDHPELKDRLDEPLPGGSFGATPLLVALQNDDRETMQALLDAGADINARSHWWAGGFGVLDSDHAHADWLIERGAVVNAHAAARMGKIDRLRELLAADPALVHARGGDGQTPLHFAANVEIAELLLDHGADIDARDVDHESTPAQWMSGDRQEVVRSLVSRGCATDLLLATALGDEELVRRHLDADPACVRMSVSDAWFPRRDPRASHVAYVWTLGWVTAHQAARNFKRESVLRLLMERSPAELKLTRACELGDDNLIRTLLANRPDLISDLTEDDLRRLPEAAFRNDAPTVQRMLAAGWPVETPGREGATALHWAAFHGAADMVREILARHPPLEARDSEYAGTPLDWAVHGSMKSWFRRKGDYASVVEALLDAGATPPARDAKPPASEAVLEVLRRRTGSA